MGTDFSTTEQSSTIIEHALLTKNLRVKLSCVESAEYSSDSGACDKTMAASTARCSSGERSRSCTKRSRTSSEQHAAVCAIHCEAEAVQVDIWPSLMVSSSILEGQEAFLESQPAIYQHLSDNSGKARPAHIAASALRRLFGLQHGNCSADGYCSST